LRLVPRAKERCSGTCHDEGTEVESQDELRRRIDEAAKYVPNRKIWPLSPQCGFCIRGPPGISFSIDEQWRKLELVVRNRSQSMGDSAVNALALKTRQATLMVLGTILSGKTDCIHEAK